MKVMILVVVDTATNPYFSNLVDIFLSDNFKKEGLLADKLSLNSNWFARQNRLTEYWLRIKPNYSTKILILILYFILLLSLRIHPYCRFF